MIVVTKSLRRDSITKIFPLETRIGLETNIPKVVARLLSELGVLIVESNIWVGVLSVHVTSRNHTLEVRV